MGVCRITGAEGAGRTARAEIGEGAFTLDR